MDVYVYKIFMAHILQYPSKIMASILENNKIRLNQFQATQFNVMPSNG